MGTGWPAFTLSLARFGEFLISSYRLKPTIGVRGPGTSYERLTELSDIRRCAAAISLLLRELVGFAVINPMSNSVEDGSYRGRFDLIAAHRVKKRDGFWGTCFGYVHCGIARPRSCLGVPFRVNGYSMILMIYRAHF